MIEYIKKRKRHAQQRMDWCKRACDEGEDFKSMLDFWEGYHSAMQDLEKEYLSKEKEKPKRKTMRSA